jgi:hypothetical protein
MIIFFSMRFSLRLISSVGPVPAAEGLRVINVTGAVKVTQVKNEYSIDNNGPSPGGDVPVAEYRG